MFFFSAKSKKEKTIAVLDIGSASVGGALVSITEKGPVVLFSVRKNILFQEELNFGKFLSSMAKTLGDVVKDIAASANGKPAEFHCFLASPWYISQTRIVRFTKERAFVVNKKMTEKLIEQEVKTFNTKIVGKSGKVDGEDTEIIEVKSIQVKLNGYETTNPYGKLAQNLEMSLYVSGSASKVLAAIESKIAEHFNVRTIHFSSFPLVAFSAIRDIFVEDKSFLFLDITGEVTDMTIVRNNVLLETISFPLGKNFLIRRITEKLNTTSDDAISSLHLYREKMATPQVTEKIKSVLAEAQDEWLKLFSQALSVFSKDLSMPHTIFFTADDDVAELFAETVRKGDFDEFTLTDNSFEVRFLDEKILAEFCKFKPGIKKDPFVIIESIFLDKIESPQ